MARPARAEGTRGNHLAGVHAVVIAMAATVKYTARQPGAQGHRVAVAPRCLNHRCERQAVIPLR